MLRVRVLSCESDLYQISDIYIFSVEWKPILRLSDQRADQVTDELMEAVRRAEQTKVISLFSLCPLCLFFANQSSLDLLRNIHPWNHVFCLNLVSVLSFNGITQTEASSPC